MKDFCLIISGSPECFVPVSCRRADYVIACDSGYGHAVRSSIKPDLCIGDFDSYQGQIPEDIETVRLNPEKDDTDTMAALRIALKKGYRDIVIIGALGRRLDHTYANLALLAYAAEHGAMCQLLDEHHQVFAVRAGSRRIKRSTWKNISVYSMTSRSTGVCLRGLKYSLENASLASSSVIGTSNEFTEEFAEISVEKGTLLVILSDIE